jgi:hypothetical protein
LLKNSHDPWKEQTLNILTFNNFMLEMNELIVAFRPEGALQAMLEAKDNGINQFLSLVFPTAIKNKQLKQLCRIA